MQVAHQTPVVQKVDNAILWILIYPMNSTIQQKPVRVVAMVIRSSKAHKFHELVFPPLLITERNKQDSN